MVVGGGVLHLTLHCYYQTNPAPVMTSVVNHFFCSVGLQWPQSQDVTGPDSEAIDIAIFGILLALTKTSEAEAK